MHLLHVARALEKARDDSGIAGIDVGFVIFGPSNTMLCQAQGIVGFVIYAWGDTCAMQLLHVARALEEATSRNIGNLCCSGMGVLSKRPRGGCARERAEQNSFTCSTIARVLRQPWDTKATMQRPLHHREQIGRRRCRAL